MKLLIKGGRVINPETKWDQVADVLIEDGKIKAIAADLTAEDAEVYPAEGKIVTPGLVDLHVHFREPGQEAKEDFESGSKAAAAGGFTTVCTMPNTKPVVDSAAMVRSLERRAEEAARVHIRMIGAVTKLTPARTAATTLVISSRVIARRSVYLSVDSCFISSPPPLLVWP